MSMFAYCYGLREAPVLNFSKAEDINSIFLSCTSFRSAPPMDLSAFQADASMLFSSCTNLIHGTQLNPSGSCYAEDPFLACYSLADATFDPTVTDWEGVSLKFQQCSMGHGALVKLLESLPVPTTGPWAITLTDNPGVPELTDAEKAIATEKGWTLTL